MTKITTLIGKGCAVKGNDIDTDQIVPARFLKEITFQNMGHYLFYDSRFDENESPKPHILNDLTFKDASILVTNKNFGCGSSREHAPQAIMRYGFKAIIGESFGEIFAGNCSQIGIPVLTAPAEHISALQDYITNNPKADITIHLDTSTIDYGSLSLSFSMPESRRLAFLEGYWDVLNLLKKNTPALKEKHTTLPYRFEQTS
jgi:3-isopropylmalate/(R)-2-methylmalate dehydratase small subunit